MKTSKEQEIIIMIFTIVSLFMMFTRSGLSSSHQFFQTQFIFLMPYLIDYYYSRSLTYIHWNYLTKLSHILYEINNILSVILLIIAVFGVSGIMSLDGTTLANCHVIVLSSFSFPLGILFIFELLSIMIINSYVSLIKNIRSDFNA